MPLRPTTSEQVDGHSFVLHRARLALTGQEITAREDRLRSQARALRVGIGIAAVLLAGAAVLGFIRPAPNVESMDLIQVRESGALYVRVADTWHPVPNIASARLISGQPSEPERVPEQALRQVRRGPAVGIPGAPTALPDDGAPQQITWTVCDARHADDARTRTILLARPGADTPPQAWTGSSAILVNREGQGWLLGDGRRTRVDLADTALLEVYGLHVWQQQHVPDALLETLPEGPPLRRIEIPQSGDAAPLGPAGTLIGEVIAVSSPVETKYFVVLAQGVQEVPEPVAELLHITGPGAHNPSPRTLAPAQVSAPRVTVLDIGGLPQIRPQQHQPEPWFCAYWQGAAGGDAPPRAGLLSVQDLAEFGGPAPLELARADGAGPYLDAVTLPLKGLFIRPAADGRTRAAGAFGAVLTNSGVQHALSGHDTAQALGLKGDALPMPAAVLRLLPQGPELGRAAASVMFDVPRIGPASTALSTMPQVDAGASPVVGEHAQRSNVARASENGVGADG